MTPVIVHCGWCGCEVNPRLSERGSVPRIGSIGFHFSCIESVDLATRILAANLAVAGALCATWEMGRRNGYDSACESEGYLPYYGTDGQWEPGCGRSAK